MQLRFVQDFPYFSRKLTDRERFGEKMCAWIQNAIMYNGVARVAGREEYLQARPQGSSAVANSLPDISGMTTSENSRSGRAPSLINFSA